MNEFNENMIEINIPATEPDRQYFFIEKCADLVHEKELKLGRKLSACIKTFGCQMNSRDSEKLTGILKEIGYEITEKEEADFVLYNTCTVRENANFKVYGRLGYLQGIKKDNPHMLIGICGCMMQEPDEVKKIKKSYRFVDVVFGTHNIFKLAEIVYGRLTSGKMYVEIQEGTADIVEDIPSTRKYPFKSGVNIMYGCNNFCSYCIVPYVRGREKSRNPQDILAEIRQLASDGVVEIMLLGQNVNSYGTNLETPVSFSRLLQMIEEIEGIQRIRFMTSHPKDLSDELIEVMKNSRKICRHLHLPLQSGSTNILSRMNRRYTKEDYLNLAGKIKDAMPEISLTTDIIVGFPGETEQDFAETLDVVGKIGYDAAFTFIYSKRTGTPAAAMEEQVPENEVKERFDRLLKLVQGGSARLNSRFTGHVVDVLIEEINEQNPELVTGRMSNNSVVHIKGGADLIGKILPVRLDCSKGFYYLGSLVSE
ncbi:tRNA (N6-isopentenyl adenosine(37)-C2)-methylthiotransferase MiaB [Parasporobacterium paucivorans]|uniref:tRNA-2-methylthio-N(6)-dimethylallyladenosine synthase n=1 Tax=Parasporobacterium paucivorans DSM 15970 TaxID=1122934 RepID=A0A1M6A1V4_9FIRM|nr:tRNA (N6-isopentenyl adenosine(37)-C2)-methylthiotransferase MiaB [Parasporobacterium paucivorans]SHI30477.1 tRNA-2-methylthio-N6-dimethylallyladenosine synthase [Parasporobacterium paucivorans DSM 15970]